MGTFSDAKRDAKDFAVLVNEDTDVDTRYGGVKPSYIKKLNQLAAGFNLTPAFDFADGFIIQTRNQSGKDVSGNYWIYNGALPFEVTAGAVPSEPDYKQVTFSVVDAVNVNNNDGLTAQSTHDATKAALVSQGLSGEYGFFADGLTYSNDGDVGIDVDGEIYTYAGSDPLPVTVVSGTDPAGDSDYLPFKINILRLDTDDVARSNKNIVVGSNAQPNSASKRDAYQVLRTITDLTDCHAIADRTVISSFTDIGTYGTFDAVTEYAHTTGTADHLYTFQGRGKKTGAGDLANYASFYSQPNMSGGTVTDLHHVRAYDVAGDSTVTNQHGVHIRPLTGGINNYALFSWGETPSIHVGHFTIGDFNVDTTAALFVKNKVTMTGFDQSGIVSDCGGNSNALTAYNAFKARVNLVGGSYSVPAVSGYTVEDANFGAGASAGAQYGFYIKDQTKGDVNAAMRLGVNAGAQKWNLYATGDAQNYLKGNLGIGVFQPSARIETASSQAGNEIAPIKIQAGALLPTAQDGALEFDGTNLYFTIGGVRRTVTLT